ncbi:hypothetical protein [Flavobacterium ovatum]|uniref:hypothetical protein n=1 Tax=Flavobacterium ovatum TaxID=1928857 RepID=UPI00344BE193
MAKNKQVNTGKSSNSQKSVDNRSNQLNPNNRAYFKSREGNKPQMSMNKDTDSDWDDDNYADDWEFNHD